jgi:alanine-synthesizing transaminase
MSFHFPARWEGREHSPNPLSEAVAKRKSMGTDLLDLTVSNPTSVGLKFPEDWPELLVGDSLRRYDPDPKGSRMVRDAIAGYYADRGESVSSDDLFLTAGTSEAYAHLFKLLCEPGDAILVPTPSYPLLETLADLGGLSFETYPLVPHETQGVINWSPEREALTAQITDQTRVLCVVQPNNPTGNILSSETAIWLIELAERYDLALIVDEVFADYRHDGAATPLLRTGGPLVFTLNGLSKLVGLPQLKLAWIHVAGNEPDKAKANDLLEWMCDAHLSVSSASQLAAPELLRRRVEFQKPIRERIATNLATLREFTATNQRLQPLWPQGGWCLPVRCVGIRDDEEFAIRLVKDEGVLIQPGYFFDFEDEETIVISLLPDPEIFRGGLTRLVRTLI